MGSSFRGRYRGRYLGVYYARNFPVGLRDRLQIGGAVVDDDDDDGDGQKLETRLSVICRRRRRLHD